MHRRFGTQAWVCLILIVPSSWNDFGRDENELLDFIKQKGAVNISDCMDRFKLSKTATYNHLKKLLELGLLKRSSRGRNVTYRAG